MHNVSSPSQQVFATLTGTAGFWFASFLWGFIVLLPHSMSSFATTQAPMGLDGVIFTGSALLGFIIESVADWQKVGLSGRCDFYYVVDHTCLFSSPFPLAAQWCFKRSPEYKERWCDKVLYLPRSSFHRTTSLQFPHGLSSAPACMFLPP